jgi:hypothetical protein
LGAIGLAAATLCGGLAHGEEAAPPAPAGESLADLVHSLVAEGVARLQEALTRQVQCDPADPLQARIFADYGAIFVAGHGARHPPRCVFTSAGQVAAFQASLDARTERIDGVAVTLQTPAMKALLAAVAEAKDAGLRISPNDRNTAARRTFEVTANLWRNHFQPSLAYWVRRGRISRADARSVRKMDVRSQVLQVLKWESMGLYFSPNHAKSILYMVAAPGTSQHLSLLAFDVKQFGDPRVRAILARHGWYRTIQSDAPHFTFVGRSEATLPFWGLKAWTMGQETFWIPDTERLLAMVAVRQSPGLALQPATMTPAVTSSLAVQPQ